MENRLERFGEVVTVERAREVLEEMTKERETTLASKAQIAALNRAITKN